MIIKYKNKIKIILELKVNHNQEIKEMLYLDDERRNVILVNLSNSYQVLSYFIDTYIKKSAEETVYTLFPNEIFEDMPISDGWILFEKYQKLFYFIEQKQKRLEIDALNFSKKDMVSELLLHLSILVDYEKITNDYALEDFISNLKYKVNKQNQNLELFFDEDNSERYFIKDTTAEITGTIKIYEYGDINFSILIVDSKIEVVKFDIDQKLFEERHLFVIEELKQANIQYY